MLLRKSKARLRRLVCVIYGYFARLVSYCDASKKGYLFTNILYRLMRQRRPLMCRFDGLRLYWCVIAARNLGCRHTDHPRIDSSSRWCKCFLCWHSVDSVDGCSSGCLSTLRKTKLRTAVKRLAKWLALYRCTSVHNSVSTPDEIAASHWRSSRQLQHQTTVRGPPLRALPLSRQN